MSGDLAWIPAFKGSEVEFERRLVQYCISRPKPTRVELASFRKRKTAEERNRRRAQAKVDRALLVEACGDYQTARLVSQEKLAQVCGRNAVVCLVQVRNRLYHVTYTHGRYMGPGPWRSSTNFTVRSAEIRTLPLRWREESYVPRGGWPSRVQAEGTLLDIVDGIFKPRTPHTHSCGQAVAKRCGKPCEKPGKGK